MTPRVHKAMMPLIGCVLLLAFAPAAAQDAGVTSEQVADSVNKAVAVLKPTLDGARLGGSTHQDGTHLLTALALLNSGISPADPVLAKLLGQVETMEDRWTYVVALKCQVLTAADPKKYFKAIETSARWLMAAQTQGGMWTYTSAAGRAGGPVRGVPAAAVRAAGGGDNSNTQFALLGLHEAAKAGVKIPKEVWARSAQHFETSQRTDGGWGYMYSRPVRAASPVSDAYGSMTAAGLASLQICGQRLHVGGEKTFANGKYPDCGKYRQNPHMKAGIAWMTDRFSVKANPTAQAGGNRGYHLYYLYAMERVGMICGLRNFGEHDWYREGAALLVEAQNVRGGWGQTSDTAFGLLFLAKGNRPVLIQKLSWDDKSGKQGSWNRNIHDLENLCSFIDDKLGKPVTWQTASLDMSVEQLRQSPILYVAGHEFPAFTRDERARLRQFIDAGGILLFEACCGSEDFRTGFRAFAKEFLPDYTLRPLAVDHPVFQSVFDMTKQRDGLEGIDVGCRTSVFFAPNALSCLWELQSVPEHSERALKLGANIAGYASGKEQLANRLDVVELPPAVRSATQPSEVPRGAVRIARLWHSGDYNADPHCLTNLAAQLRQKAKLSVVASERHIAATDEKLYDYPVLFMTGHAEFKLTDEEVAALRKYLDKGGVLVADACCGQKAFDDSFRQLVKQLYPAEEFKNIAADHPLYSGKFGLPMGELKYRQVLAEEIKARGTSKPPLEAVMLKKGGPAAGAAKSDEKATGRTAILYSRYDFTCGLEGDNPYSCRGYVDADAQKLAVNIFLYAITY